MHIKTENIKEAVEKALKERKKRKFLESLELIINFRGIDFTKPENRINIDVILPNGKGKKANKLVVVGSEALVSQAKKLGVEKPILTTEVPNISAKEVKRLSKEHFFLAEPKAIGIVAKHWGKILGPRGKIPKPLIGDIKKAIEQARKIVRIQTKGKYLPTIQAFFGEEEMDVAKLVENAEAIINEIKKKIPEGNIKSMYVKTTMGKPVRVKG